MIPSNLRVPFVAINVDNSQAIQAPATLAYRVLLIGQKIAAGSALANSLHRVTSAEQVASLAGRGSQLHRQAVAYFANNRSTETWIGVLEDSATGTAATGTITFTGPATAAGTIALYVAGERVTVGVLSGDAVAAIATAAAAAINAVPGLPVTAAAALGVVTLTARNKGLCGNDIVTALNVQDGDVLPSGVGATVAAMSAGATNPVLTSLIAAMGDNWYHVIAHPYTDATSLTALEDELASRFGAMRMIDGLAITSSAGSHGALTTLGDGRNSPHSVIIAQDGDAPLTPPAEFAAAVAGVIALHAPEDPARPLQTLPIAGVRPVPEASRFTLEERNLLLYDGIATTRTTSTGAVQIERVITTYQENSFGGADTSYLDASTLLTILYLRYSLRTQIQTRFPRHKLANDGVRAATGQPIVTPKIAKAEACAWFRDMEQLGLVEGFDAFKAALHVERDASDVNRLNFLVPPDLINQFIVGAINLQFRL